MWQWRRTASDHSAGQVLTKENHNLFDDFGSEDEFIIKRIGDIEERLVQVELEEHGDEEAQAISTIEWLPNQPKDGKGTLGVI